MIIERGTIKVVWIGKNSKRIYSMMFDEIKSAEKWGKSKKDYLIFKLIKHNKMRSFEWEILPYGNYRQYLSLVKNYNKYGIKFHNILNELFK